MDDILAELAALLGEERLPPGRIHISYGSLTGSKVNLAAAVDADGRLVDRQSTVARWMVGMVA